MSNPITVVLGCARSKRTLLAPVVEVLAGRGRPVEVVSGIETTDGPWQDALRRHGRHAVYLVCGDPELTLDRIAALRKAMAMAAIPISQLWCGPADWVNPSAILRHAEQLLRGTEAPAAASSDPSGRTVLPPPAPPLPPARPLMNHVSAPINHPHAHATAPSASSSQNAYLDDEGLAGSRRLKVALGGIAGVAVVAALAIFMWPDGEPGATSDDTSSSEPAVAAAVKTDRQETPTKTAEEAAPEAAAEPPAEPPAASDQDGEDAGLGGEGPEADPGPEGGEEESIEIEARPSSDMPEAERIFTALAEQKIRALDILLMSPQAEKERGKYTRPAKLRFEEAEQHCAGLSVDGIDGWRLPSAGELSSLTAGNMLARSVYWSSTKGDSFGNKRVVWNAARRKMVSVTTRWKGARTICVRVYDPSR